jgi:hypothetical protein
MVSNAVEDEVVLLATLGEILLGVVNDAICAERFHHVQIPRAAYAGHMCIERFADLHSERTHASGCTVNQNLNASEGCRPTERRKPSS